MNFLRDLLVRNFGLKMISLLIGVLLWLQIANQQTVQRTVSVPVEFTNIPANLEIVNDYEKQVDVVIRAQRTGSPFVERQLSAVVDLKGADPGIEIIPLTPANIRDSYGVEILSVSPPRIRLQLEPTARKTVEVKPRVLGTPAQGHEVVRIELLPQHVVVSGPESHVAKISEVETEPVRVAGRGETFTTELYVDMEDPQLRTENNASVRATVVIEEKRQNIRLAQVPVRFIPESADARLLTKSVTVVGSVPVSLAKQLRSSDLQAVVDVADLAPRRESYEVVPEVIIPNQFAGLFQVRELSPQKVKVRKVQ